MRKVFGVVIIALLFLLLSLATALWWAQRALTEAGVQDVHWQGLGWQQGGLHLQQLSFALPAGQVALEQLRLVPGWRGGPRIRVLALEHAQLRFDARDSRAETDAPGIQVASLTAPELWNRVVNWLPDQVSIAELEAQVPCHTGTCELNGSLQASREPGNLDAGEPVLAKVELRLQAGDEQLLLQQQVQAESKQLTLQASLLVDQQLAAQLQSRWQGLTQWQGSLNVPGWPQTSGLYKYLGNWMALGTLPVSTLPPGAQLALDWDLISSQPPASWVDWLGGKVELNAQLALPQPWQIEQLGSVGGNLQVQLRADQGRWQVLQGEAQLALNEPQLTVLEALPGNLQVKQLQLQVTPAPSTQLTAGEAIPFLGSFSVLGANGLAGTLKGDMALLLPQVQERNWRLQFLDTQLELQLASWQEQDVQLRDLRVITPITGELDGLGAELQGGSAGQVNWSQLQLSAADLTLNKASLKLTKLSYQQRWQEPGSLRAGSQLSGNVARLEQPQLKPLRWDVDGRWSYADSALQWQGKLSNAAGLALDTDFNLPPRQPWRSKITLQPLFFRAGNPLADSVVAWPVLLSLSSGQLSGQLQASGGSAPLSLQGNFNVSGGKGIYDRSAFSGLVAPVTLKLQGNNLLLGSTALQLESFNPGLEMGPLRAAASYRATTDDLMRGRLQLDQAQLQMLGGQVTAEPAQLDLSANEQRLVLNISGLELDTLFAVYPTEGLSGRGTLDGRLPVVLRDGELMVDAGAVAAREPGGVLRYQSDKLQRLAQSNAGMRELAGALDNFHYTVLSSQVNYAEDGNLQLGLRLQGSNPNFQQGRQVNLNVNLEENIPALLTSLQLSSQVSDIIQQRVQERLLKQRLQPNKE